MWRKLYACPAAGGRIQRVFTAAGKQHADDLKKKTVEKTLESSLKAGMDTELPSGDDTGVCRGDEGTYINRK